jgi:hypothetical protein
LFIRRYIAETFDRDVSAGTEIVDVIFCVGWCCSRSRQVR